MHEHKLFAYTFSRIIYMVANMKTNDSNTNDMNKLAFRRIIYIVATLRKITETYDMNK
jgi:hypothetical protein